LNHRSITNQIRNTRAFKNIFTVNLNIPLNKEEAKIETYSTPKGNQLLFRRAYTRGFDDANTKIRILERKIENLKTEHTTLKKLVKQTLSSSFKDKGFQELLKQVFP